VIQRQSHSTIYVIDQVETLGFYRNDLSFEFRPDMPVTEEGSVRWLTMSHKGQPDLEIVLMPIIPGPVFDAEAAEQMKAAGPERSHRARRVRGRRRSR